MNTISLNHFKVIQNIKTIYIKQIQNIQAISYIIQHYNYQLLQQPLINYKYIPSPNKHRTIKLACGEKSNYKETYTDTEWDEP